MKKKHLNILLILLITIGASTSCYREKSVPLSVIRGTATPVYLSYKGGTVILNDYFATGTTIDSIENHKHYKTLWSANKKSLTITPMPGLGSITNLRLWTHGIPNDVPLYKSKEEPFTFTFPDAAKKYHSVMIKGSFNGWVPEQSMMEYKNGMWRYTTMLTPGQYQYLYVVDGKEMPQQNKTKNTPRNTDRIPAVAEVGTRAQPPYIVTHQNKGDSFTLKTSQPLQELLVYHENQRLSSAAVAINGEKITIQIPQHATSGRSMLRIYAYNENGIANDLAIPMENNKVITEVSLLNRTDFHTQIMYFLMVDRFKDGDTTNTKRIANDSILPKVNYFGGDLQGIIDKIDDGYFEKIGINTLWLSPITQNPDAAYGLWKNPLTKFSGYHGYWPVSNTKIDYRFGNDAIFRLLLQKAHAKDMNVILDYVANHVHEEHPLYKAHPDWATDRYLPDGTLNTEKWDSHRLTTWFDTFLPTLNFSNPEVISQMTDSAAYWITQYELDGFRHDATKHIDEAFWRTLTKKIKTRTQRPVYQIGETYGSYELIRSYINTGMLDAQFDFNLYDAAVSAFSGKESSFVPLKNTLMKSMEYYGFNHLMGNITGNQDRARFISYASGDIGFNEDAKIAGWIRNITVSDTLAYKRLEMLHAFNLVIPGIPCIYYGDEYGSPGGNDPDNRRMMKFKGLNDQELKLRGKVSALIGKRKNHMALLYGTTKILRADQHMFIIKRCYFEEEVIIIFNTSSTEKTFDYYNKQTKVNPMDYAIIFNS